MPLTKLPELALYDAYKREGFESEGYSFDEFLAANKEVATRDQMAVFVEDIYERYYEPEGVSREEYDDAFGIRDWEDQFPGRWENEGRYFKERASDWVAGFIRSTLAPQLDAQARMAPEERRTEPEGFLERFGRGQAVIAGGLHQTLDPHATRGDYQQAAERLRLTAKELADRDYGYDPEADPQWMEGGGLESAKAALNVAMRSLPEMGAMLVALPAYVAGRAGEITYERVQADGREEPTANDWLIGWATAAGVSAVDRLHLSRLLKVGEGGKAYSRILSKILGEAATEAGQEGAEYLAERLGTQAGVDAGELGKVTSLGATAGGMMGGGVATGAEILGGSRRIPPPPEQGAQPAGEQPPPRGVAPPGAAQPSTAATAAPSPAPQGDAFMAEDIAPAPADTIKGRTIQKQAEMGRRRALNPDRVAAGQDVLVVQPGEEPAAGRVTETFEGNGRVVIERPGGERIAEIRPGDTGIELYEQRGDEIDEAAGAMPKAERAYLGEAFRLLRRLENDPDDATAYEGLKKLRGREEFNTLDDGQRDALDDAVEAFSRAQDLKKENKKAEDQAERERKQQAKEAEREQKQAEKEAEREAKQKEKDEAKRRDKERAAAQKRIEDDQKQRDQARQKLADDDAKARSAGVIGPNTIGPEGFPDTVPTAEDFAKLDKLRKQITKAGESPLTEDGYESQVDEYDRLSNEYSEFRNKMVVDHISGPDQQRVAFEADERFRQLLDAGIPASEAFEQTIEHLNQLPADQPVTPTVKDPKGLKAINEKMVALGDELDAIEAKEEQSEADIKRLGDAGVEYDELQVRHHEAAKAMLEDTFGVDDLTSQDVAMFSMQLLDGKPINDALDVVLKFREGRRTGDETAKKQDRVLKALREEAEAQAASEPGKAPSEPKQPSSESKTPLSESNERQTEPNEIKLAKLHRLLDTVSLYMQNGLDIDHPMGRAAIARLDKARGVALKGIADERDAEALEADFWNAARFALRQQLPSDKDYAMWQKKIRSTTDRTIRRQIEEQKEGVFAFGKTSGGKPKEKAPSEPKTPEKVQPGEEREAGTLEGKPYYMSAFTPDQVSVDPRRFQFKKDAVGEGGTDNTFTYTKKWSDVDAGELVFWQDRKGDTFVVDGHQRFGLATRLWNEGDKSIVLRGQVFKWSDGWSAERARLIGARRNIKQAHGTAWDAADVFRAFPEELESGEYPNTRITQRGRDIAALSEQAAGQLKNTFKDRPQIAAVVGRLAGDKSPATQLGLARAITEAPPKSEAAAEHQAHGWLAHETGVDEDAESGSIFGAEDVSASHFKRYGELIQGLSSRLKRVKAAMNAAVKHRGKIEAHGVGDIDTAIAFQAARTASEQRNIFQQMAHTKGPVGDAIQKALKQWKDDSSQAEKNRAIDLIEAAVVSQYTAMGGQRNRTPKQPGETVSDEMREVATRLAQSWVQSPQRIQVFVEQKTADSKQWRRNVRILHDELSELGFKISLKESGRIFTEAVQAQLDGGQVEGQDSMFREAAYAASRNPEVRAEVQAIFRRIAPRGVRLRLRRTLREGNRSIAGRFTPNQAGGLIEVATSADPVATLGHEVIHALKSRGLVTPREWAVLERVAREQDWIGAFNVRTRNPELDQEAQTEEAIAEAFGRWLRFRNFLDTKISPVVGRIFERIRQFFLQVAEALGAKGYEGAASAAVVFDNIYSGDVGSRAWVRGNIIRTAGAPRFSARLPFYSKAREALASDKAPGKASADEWMRYLSASGRGIKTVELADVPGLREGLARREKNGRVTKRDALEVFDAVAPQVEVVELVDDQPHEEELEWITGANADSAFRDSAIARNDAQALTENMMSERAEIGASAIHDYFHNPQSDVEIAAYLQGAPGGPTVVIFQGVGPFFEEVTDPTVNPPDAMAVSYYESGAPIPIVRLDLDATEMMHQFDVAHQRSPNKKTKWSTWTHRGPKEQYRESVILSPGAFSDVKASRHFQMEGEVVHVRTSVRQLDGRKTLFIEEIQSDNHQLVQRRQRQARDKKIETENAIEEARFKLLETLRAVGRLARDARRQEGGIPTKASRALTAIEDEAALRIQAFTEGAPDGKSIDTYTLERALRESGAMPSPESWAVIGGVGQSRSHESDLSWRLKQAERNTEELSKLLNRTDIPWRRTENWSGLAFAHVLEMAAQNPDIKAIAWADGKSMEWMEWRGSTRPSRELKTFYDRILPKVFARRYRQAGGTGRVSKILVDDSGPRRTLALRGDAGTGLPAVRGYTMPFTEDMRADILKRGQPKYRRLDTDDEPIVPFDDPAIEQKWQDARAQAVKEDSLKERAKEFFDRPIRRFTRTHEYINEADPENAVFLSMMRELKSKEDAAVSNTVDAIKRLSTVPKDNGKGRRKLTDKEADMIVRKLVLQDGLYNEEHEIPFGFTPEQARFELAKIDSALSRPEYAGLNDTVEATHAMFRDMAAEQVAAGILTLEQVQNPNYFPRQVLKFMRALDQAYPGSGNVRRRWWKQRKGSAEAINVDFATVIGQYLVRHYQDVAAHGLVDELAESKYNHLPRLRQAAADRNNQVLRAALQKEVESVQPGADVDMTSLSLVRAYGRLAGDRAADMPLLAQYAKFHRAISEAFFQMTEIAQRLSPDAMDALPRHTLRLVMEARTPAMARGLNDETGQHRVFATLAAASEQNEVGELRSQARKVLALIGARGQWLAENGAEGEPVNPRSAEALVKAFPQLAEGLAIWQPDSFDGKTRAINYFMAKSIDVHRADRILDDLPAQIAANPAMLEGSVIPAADVVELLSKARDVLAFGAPKQQMLLPEDIAATLREFRDKPIENLIARIARVPARTWRTAILFQPWRLVKYNANNVSGDSDPVFADMMGERWMRAVPVAARVLRDGDSNPIYRDAQVDGIFFGRASSDFRSAAGFARDVRLNQYGVAEMARASPNKLAEGVRWYFDKAITVSTLREDLFRLSWYIAFRKAMVDEGLTTMETAYGSTRRSVREGLAHDPRRLAARMARDVAGDYGNLTHYGRLWRNTIFPFWGWRESNTVRYWWRVRNLLEYSRDIGDPALGRKLALKAIASGTMRLGVNMGLRGAGLGLWAGVAYTGWMAFQSVLLRVWNESFFGEEEEALSAEQKTRQHIMLRGTDDELIYMHWPGGLADMLQMMGVEQAYATYLEMQADRATAKDVLKSGAKGSLSTLTNSVTPLVKTPVELIAGRSFFPDPTRPLPIRDRGQHLARTFALEREYELIRDLMGEDLPGRPYSSRFPEVLIFRRRKDEQAYFNARSNTYDWTAKQRGDRPRSRTPTRRQNLYWNIRMSRYYGDKESEEAARRNLIRLFMKEDGLTEAQARKQLPTRLSRSLQRSHPFADLTISDRRRRDHLMNYIGQLSPRDRNDMRRAIYYYHRVIHPGYQPRGLRAQAYRELRIDWRELNERVAKGG